MGGPKALLEWEGETLLSRALRLYLHPAVDVRVAVLGCEAARARQAVAADVAAGVNWAPNADWERGGMLSSVLCGLDAAECLGADAVLLHPVDHPFVEPETVASVCAALAAGARLVVPVHAGRRGHPGGFARASFAALRAAPADGGARAVLRDPAADVTEVAGGAGCLQGLDTPDDVARCRRRE